jgi:hypothetical protein
MVVRIRWVILSAAVILCTVILSLSACTSSPKPPIETDGGLLILSHSTYVDIYGYFHMVGEVQNVGKCSTTDNWVSVTFYDEEGLSSVTGSGPCFKEIIAPSEKSPFEVIFPKAPQHVNLRLTTQWQATEMQPIGQMVFEEINSTIDTEGQYAVTGRIVNGGSQAVEYAMVLSTLYDSSGKVVAVAFVFADDSPIGVGNSSSFAILTDPSVSAKIDNFVLEWETP